MMTAAARASVLDMESRPRQPTSDDTERAELDAELAAILADALVADFLDDRRRDGQSEANRR